MLIQIFEIISSVLILIFLAMVFISLILCVRDTVIEERKLDCLKKELYDEYSQYLLSKSIKPFIVSEYLSRIEQENLKIMEERENKEEYIITLWIGLDGLRMKDNGEFEWITRMEKKEEIPSTFVDPGMCHFINPTSFTISIPPTFFTNPMYQPCYHPYPNYINYPYYPMLPSYIVQQQIQATTSEIQSLQLILAQQMETLEYMEQDERIFNEIRAVKCPEPITSERYT